MTRRHRILSKKPTFAHFAEGAGALDRTFPTNSEKREAIFSPIDGGLSARRERPLLGDRDFRRNFPPVESNHNLPHDRSGSQPAIRKDHEIPPAGFGSSFFEAIRSVSQAEHPATRGKHTADDPRKSRYAILHGSPSLHTCPQC